MSANFHPNQWNPAAPGGTAVVSPQRGLSLHAEAPPPQPFRLLPPSVLTDASFSNVLQHAALYSGFDHLQLADATHISKSYMTKFLGGVGERWARLLVRFVRKTGCLGPLQWIANEVGCDVVPKDGKSTRIAQLQAELHDLQRRCG
jgi:hypothetical protein